MRSRRNNTTLTRKVDKWNTRKVWLIKRYADGHYALHAKRARVRKKYRNRIRRAFFAALASEGGGSS